MKSCLAALCVLFLFTFHSDQEKSEPTKVKTAPPDVAATAVVSDDNKVFVDYQMAIDEGARTGKPVFLYVFDSVWGVACKALEKELADGQFAEVQKKFVVARLDSRNGTAEFVKKLKIQRNTSYLLLLKRFGEPNILRKVVNPDYPLDEFARLTNPKDMKTIIGLTELMIDSEK